MKNYSTIFKICDNAKDFLSSKKVLMKEWSGDIIFLPSERQCYIRNSVGSGLKWCLKYSPECAFAYAAMYIARESTSLDSYFTRMGILTEIKKSFESFGETFNFPFLEINTENMCSSFVFTKKDTRRFIFSGFGGFFIWDTETSKFVSHESYKDIDSFIKCEIPFILAELQEVEQLIK